MDNDGKERHMGRWRCGLAILLILACGTAFADTVALNAPVELSVPTATKLVIDRVEIKNHNKELRVFFHWEAASGERIRLYDTMRSEVVWVCQDVEDNPLTPVDETDACFSDTFGFTIRQQDVGTRIGAGLRALIWAKMKSDVLSGGNDGSFE